MGITEGKNIILSILTSGDSMDRPVLKYIVAVFIIQFITACGGGSSTDSGPISPPQDGELQFQSGFEPNVVVASRSAEAGTIQGIDQSSPSELNDWDELPTYLNWMTLPVGYFEGGSAAVVQDPTNYVLQLKNTRDEGGSCPCSVVDVAGR
jgi:hypothetical protein